MKFKDLAINQTFTTQEYPECIGVKMKYFGGSCCSPPHNAKLVCQVDKTSQEKAVLFDDDQEVVPQPSEKSVQPALLSNPMVLDQQVKIGEQKRKREKRVGYKWVGKGPDPSVHGGTFGGTISKRPDGDEQDSND